jgi:chaperonin GroEL
LNNVLKNKEVSWGFNAATEVYEDLSKAGVIDPTKVVRCALQNAGSIAGLLLTTEVMIAEKPKKGAAGNMASMEGMGGMGGMM